MGLNYPFSISSYRLARSAELDDAPAFTSMTGGVMGLFSKSPLPPHSSHPDFGHLIVLVLGAVLEVVCVSLPGYIVARLGMFDAEAQKFLANLNTQLFTPCLIFTKLAAQLTAETLADLAVIPVIFVVQILVSYLCAVAVSKAFRFHKRAQNFVIAMAIFGNSNSLPISLVISLSKTLSGLHWDKIPGDNDNEVEARGILYLLIFQQLGQLVRWSYGFNVLLAPPEKYKQDLSIEEGRYADGDSGTEDERQRLIADGEEASSIRSEPPPGEERTAGSTSDYESGAATPMNRQTHADSEDSCSCCSSDGCQRNVVPTPSNGNSGLPNGECTYRTGFKKHPSGPKGWWSKSRDWVHVKTTAVTGRINTASTRVFNAFPASLQKVFSRLWFYVAKYARSLWEGMNMPLWAMLAALIVASVPQLQHLFFDRGSFINNSVTRAVAQSGGVAVPLILVVLGANLARNTLPPEQLGTDDPKEERNILIASLVSRMLLPTVIMAPILAVTAKYVPISILDDPIFIIVCFLLTGAPSALQLAQMCQINNVYMGAMSRLLFQSYVIWILPSTLILVMLAVETGEWARQ